VAETPLVNAALRGLDYRIICTISTSTKHVRCAARGISRPEELKGKKVATALGTNNAYYMDRFLETHGLARQDVEVINLTPTEMTNALISGQVSAIFCFEPFLSKAKERLGSELTVFPPGAYYTVTYSVVAKSELIRDKPELVNDVLRTLLRSAEFLKEHRQESIAIVAKQLGLEEAFLSGFWDAYRFEVTLDDDFIRSLDEEAAWARRGDPTLKDAPRVDFRSFIAEAPLKALKPDAVRITRP
jgi:NitT/TauT family transport system substrate-binding protein